MATPSPMDSGGGTPASADLGNEGSSPVSSMGYDDDDDGGAGGGGDNGASPSPSPSGRGAANGGFASAAADAGARAAARGLRELGGLAAWSVTSAKPGNGVELLRDGSAETFWQSDGTQPHLVSIQFPTRTEIAELHLYLDFRADESYTPSRLAVRAGTTHRDLRDVCVVELREPTGWVVVPLAQQKGGGAGVGEEGGAKDGGGGGGGNCGGVRAFYFQVAVLANHQNGRDTHIRQVAVYGQPGWRPAGLAQLGLFASHGHERGAFSSVEFAAFSGVR